MHRNSEAEIPLETPACYVWIRLRTRLRGLWGREERTTDKYKWALLISALPSPTVNQFQMPGFLREPGRAGSCWRRGFFQMQGIAEHEGCEILSREHGVVWLDCKRCSQSHGWGEVNSNYKSTGKLSSLSLLPAGRTLLKICTFLYGRFLLRFKRVWAWLGWKWL